MLTYFSEKARSLPLLGVLMILVEKALSLTAVCLPAVRISEASRIVWQPCWALSAAAPCPLLRNPQAGNLSCQQRAAGRSSSLVTFLSKCRWEGHHVCQSLCRTPQKLPVKLIKYTEEVIRIFGFYPSHSTNCC